MKKTAILALTLLASTAFGQERFQLKTNAIVTIPPLVITNDAPLIAAQLAAITNSSGQPIMGSIDKQKIHDINIRILSKNKMVIFVR